MMEARGLRNNNPGNIRNSDAAGWKGEVSQSDKKDSVFEEFEDMPHGYRALLRLLQNYRRIYNVRTMSDFISRWAPRTENNTTGYLERVCKEMNVAPAYVPDVNDKETMCRLAAAISQVENAVPAVMADVEAGWDLL